jgi:hypothetical protein
LANIRVRKVRKLCCAIFASDTSAMKEANERRVKMPISTKGTNQAGIARDEKPLSSNGLSRAGIAGSSAELTNTAAPEANHA